MLRVYRGREGMISWAFHRLTGLGVLMFLFIHIADIFVIGYGPKQFNDLLFLYNAAGFRILEILLVGAVYYHAINGVRIIVIDFWDGAVFYQRQLFYGVVVIFLAAFIPTAIRMALAMF
jgi:succinate dehydrogenase / fumarate reductase cytochrome b subunit